MNKRKRLQMSKNDFTEGRSVGKWPRENSDSKCLVNQFCHILHKFKDYVSFVTKGYYQEVELIGFDSQAKQRLLSYLSGLNLEIIEARTDRDGTKVLKVDIGPIVNRNEMMNDLMVFIENEKLLVGRRMAREMMKQAKLKNQRDEEEAKFKRETRNTKKNQLTGVGSKEHDNKERQGCFLGNNSSKNRNRHHATCAERRHSRTRSFVNERKANKETSRSNNAQGKVKTTRFANGRSFKLLNLVNSSGYKKESIEFPPPQPNKFHFCYEAVSIPVGRVHTELKRIQSVCSSPISSIRVIPNQTSKILNRNRSKSGGGDLNITNRKNMAISQMEMGYNSKSQSKILKRAQENSYNSEMTRNSNSDNRGNGDCYMTKDRALWSIRSSWVDSELPASLTENQREAAKHLPTIFSGRSTKSPSESSSLCRFMATFQPSIPPEKVNESFERVRPSLYLKSGRHEK